MNRRTFLLAVPGVVAGVVPLRGKAAKVEQASPQQGSDLRARFDYLSTHGNSNCSNQFLASIPSMPDSMMLQGSCCAPMDYNTYVSQITALRKYQSTSEIPSDPYNIPAKLAKQLLGFDQSITLTAAEQAVLDDAVPRTKEQGFCCCQCWRWYTFEGMSKYLVQNYGFTADQIVDVLNNLDGCGGASQGPVGASVFARAISPGQ